MNISKLIQLEWLKYKKNKTFLVSLILFAVFLPGSVLTILSFGSMPEGFPQPRDFFNFPEVWSLLAYAGNWLAYFIFGFLGVYMITMEISNRTLRQSVINGLDRKELITGKITFLFLVALAATVFYILSTFLLAFLGSDPYAGTPLWGEELVILRFFIMVLSYLIFGFLIGLITRSMGLGVLIYFMWVFFIEAALRWLVHYQLIENRSMSFYPMNAVEDLTPSPLYEYAEFTASGNGVNLLDILLTPTEALITSTAYMILFIVICYQIVLRRDL
jgi:ABC-type transport system involved in multi-copper enzyme maturation permease subunit